MKTKYRHPIWTHLPAAAVLIAFLTFVIKAWPLPARVPVHFNAGGIPNSYGSPWLVIGMVFGLSIMFIIISFVLDDIWASQERKKVYNWFAIMDELIVGALGGVGIGFLLYLESGADTFSFPWALLLALGGGSTLLALILEKLRPFSPHSLAQSLYGKEPVLDKELAARTAGNAAFVFWDSQNPPLVTLGAMVLPLVMFGSAALAYSTLPWLTIELVVIGLLFFIPYGGMRVMVTRREIIIRFGLFGFRVLRLDMENIAAVEAVEFSPLKDFGGYGIRINREMKAFYLRGRQGVKLTTSDGKKYLIGSEDAAMLAGVIRTLVKPGITGLS